MIYFHPSALGEHHLELPFYIDEWKLKYQNEIFYRVQNYIETLCLVKGCSVAPGFSLDRTHLTFGNVIVDYERKMNVVLRNTGYVLVGTNLIFDVFFRPKIVQCWFTCLLKNINKKLELVISGSCIHMPPPRSTIHFSCPVRQSDKKTVTISNPTNIPWEIVPKISEEAFFKPQDIVYVPERSDAVCEITYAPLDTHEHTVYFLEYVLFRIFKTTLTLATPDGLMLSYILKGTANPPLPAGKIRREVLCKVQHTENFIVTNWLQIKQQFHVSTAINGHVSAKNLFSVVGNELIEVTPNGSRIYKWKVTPINEGPLELKVVSSNVEKIPQTKIIKLENSVNVPVTYHMTCPQDNLEFEKSVTLEPHSVYYLELLYKPLKTEHVTRMFEASCKELGTFCYNIILTAHSPVPESAVSFKAFFGQSITQKMNVIATADCSFEFGDAIFSLEKVISDHSISVNFEPNQTGKFQSRLVLKSSHLGEFIYPLIGESCPPKPQGPFLLKYSSPLTINFKNPFSEDKEFYFHVEPTDFKIKQQKETIGAKKVFKVTINMVGQKVRGEPKYPITGKLMIYSKRPDIFWVYYLKENLE
ncbi:hypothetical protein BDFB_000799 [Asbolus verrucosus]|uniref:Hydrocephalus-inducing protein-like n=1 Tax=Asbolus verrucosus TaxID=1661398 RepID=A0A482WEQ0_ASBVE|nr:hypothetical protein BDFB_000799 [Asbolus verrucosus]